MQADSRQQGRQGQQGQVMAVVGDGRQESHEQGEQGDRRQAQPAAYVGSVPGDGADQRDINNPDPQLRQRRLLDTPILSNLREDGDSWKGEIYDPKRGRSFRSVVRRAGPGTLEVKGCAGPFCQTQTWRRAN